MSQGIVAGLEPANVNNPTFCARQNLPAVMFDGRVIGRRCFRHSQVDNDLVAIRLDVDHPSVAASKAFALVPGQHVAT
jgi:hypothetical protein